MRRNRGFSLIELLIVVAIILVIAAMAIPSYLHARMAANESSAVAALRTLNTAQVTYNSSYPTVGFASSLTALAGTSCNPPTSSSACLIDTALAGGLRNGYTFTLTPGSASSSGTLNAYTIISAPVQAGYSGGRYFCTFQDAVVRASDTTISTCDATVTPQQ